MPDTKVSEYPAFYFEQIETKIIDGKKYIVIPIDDNEQANVNGIEKTL